MIEAYFSNIKSELIQKIDCAKDEIFVAVAWFTQKDLFEAVLNALERNVKVSLLLVNDIINRSEYGLNFAQFIQKGGKLSFINSRKILMHNKFCVFDNSLLITGSYNWTYSAEKNAENILITDDSKVCNEYHEHYVRLWNELEETTEYSPIKLNDTKPQDFIRDYDNFLDEIQVMTSEKVLTPDIVTNINDKKNNIAIAQLATIKTEKNRRNPRLKANIGERCRINGIDDRTLNIIKGGCSLPCTSTVDIYTARDNQTKILCDILLGNNDKADDNISLLKIELDDLPLLKAGQVKFKTKVTIDTNGYLHVEFLCVNTGVSKEAFLLDPSIINY